MPLVLRVDVDKPYGNSTFYNSIKSKLSEDYWFPDLCILHSNYLYHLEKLIELCNEEAIKGYIYFRRCTVPNKRILNLISKGGHKLGIHAENTKNLVSLQDEVNVLMKIVPTDITSFSKHGSGELKLGRFHYPPYEPDKYLSWASDLNLKFYFGNNIPTNADDFKDRKNYFPKIFWLEREYREKSFFNLSDVINTAKKYIVPILIHPSNFDSTDAVRNDFKELIKLAKENNVKWILLS